MNQEPFQIVGIGEVLWDVLPGGKQIGGAPANFAFVAAQLGNAGIVASRVGDDRDGHAIINQLQTGKVKIGNIQIDRSRSTGTVEIEIENGQPSYRIATDAAWDFLKLSHKWRNLAESCDAVCFGSLAQRSLVSRQTVCEFLRLVKPAARRIFDCNLRQQYFSKETLNRSFKLANTAKLNHEELFLIAQMFEIGGANEVERAANLREKFELDLVCVTRGARGSLLLTENEHNEHHGIKIEIRDTIGAGDAFTATLAHGLLRGWDLNKINSAANQVAAFIASQTGAMPDFSTFVLPES